MIAPRVAITDGALRRVSVVAAALAACTVVMAVYVAALTPGQVPADGRIAPPQMVFAIASVLFAVVGFIIARRQPRNVMGWLLLTIGICIPLGSANNYAINSVYEPAAFPAAAIVQLVGRMGSLLALILLVSSFLFFPDGRLLSRRFRWFVWLAVVAGIFVEARTLLDTSALDYGSVKLANPTGIAAAAGLVRALEVLAFPSGLAAAIAGVVSLVLRYRRGNAETRHQLKWVVAALIWFLGCMAFAFLAPVLLNISTRITDVAVAVGYPVLPISVGIAVLKYRLYDIDVVISRTLVYGALAAFITAVYVGIVVGIGAVVGSGGQPNLVLSIIATAVVAVGFQPVRERLQKVANRIVYGKRATPYEVLSEFSERVAETYAADEAMPRMAKVLAEGTGAEHAEVWLRGGASLRSAASWPAEANGRTPLPVTGQLLPKIPETDRAVPVRHQGELLGALTVSKRRGEAMTPVEDKLLEDLASQAGLVLKNVGLTAELLARLDDLRASRQRLVAAQDEERRKLERNLHDGAQQNLVALKVKLGLAEMLAEKDPEKAKTLLAELKGDTDETLETLRDLARGIYPPLLADKGLAAALAAQARKATLPVDVEGMEIGRYPQDTEAAVYFCVLEALQNVQKYARASRATVRLVVAEETLSFEVEDDGDGFDVASAKKGSGLTNMADRLDALGGTVEVHSTPGSGSTLRGQLPIANATRVAMAP